jgi:peptidyl-prolyl cis-trans isomerase C
VKQGVALAGLCLIWAIVGGCNGGADPTAEPAKPVMAPAPVLEEGLAAPADKAETAPVTGSGGAAAAGRASAPAAQGAIAVEVDGVKLTQKQLDGDVQKRIAELKGQIPEAQLKQAKTEIRKALIDEFVVNTLLEGEIGKRKIMAGDKEVGAVIEAMKAQLPPGVTMESLLKKNQIDPKKMHDEIALNIQINKLILQELGGKVTVTDKETQDFYQKNQQQFKEPESVHARHLLVAFGEEDTEKVKAEKRAKAEDLRKKLLAGGDFADLAAKHSDCPSKQNGGDLGTFTRGQMVKAFEDAAFSQEPKTIGPVVETTFGFHIIEVLEHKAEQTTKLDKEVKKQITAYLETQKQQAAFQGLIKKMRAKANIVVYGK